jgi:hypothetical protein
MPAAATAAAEEVEISGRASELALLLHRPIRLPNQPLDIRAS